MGVCRCVFTCVYMEGWDRGEREKVDTWFIYFDLYKGRKPKSV